MLSTGADRSANGDLPGNPTCNGDALRRPVRGNSSALQEGMRCNMSCLVKWDDVNMQGAVHERKSGLRYGVSG